MCSRKTARGKREAAKPEYGPHPTSTKNMKPRELVENMNPGGQNPNLPVIGAYAEMSPFASYFEQRMGWRRQVSWRVFEHHLSENKSSDNHRMPSILQNIYIISPK